MQRTTCLHPETKSFGFTARHQRPAFQAANTHHRHRLLVASNNNSQDFLSSLGLPVQDLVDAAQKTFSRVERILTPPPPGFPPGPSEDVALQLLDNPLSFLDSLPQTYGDVIGMSLAGERVVLVTDPTIAKQVLVEQSEVYIKQGTAFFPGSSLAGNGLLVSDGDVWRRQRQLSTPAFRKTAIDVYSAAMVAETKNMLLNDKWRKAPQVRNVYADFNEVTLSIVLRALFGSAVAETQGLTEAIRTAFEYFAKRATTAFAIPEALPTPDNLKFKTAVARLDTLVYSIISTRRQKLETEQQQLLLSAAAAQQKQKQGDDNNAEEESTVVDIQPSDLLDSLLLSKDDSGNTMKDTALRDELMTLIIAGQETSAILLGWVCAFLSRNTIAQNAAAAETLQVLQGRQPTSEDVRSGNLQYLESVILESLRLMPPAYLVGRCACVDTELAGYSLPQGTTVLVSPYVIHRDGRWWGEDSGVFRPERWLVPIDSNRNSEGGSTTTSTGTKQQKAGIAMALSSMGPNGAFFPFGAGQRNCIGTGFAMMEAVLMLSMILQKYKLVAIPGSMPPQVEPIITLRPKSVRLLLRKR